MIELKVLNLDGWLSYDKATIPLNQPGITRIAGPIGAGKSAILEAIFYLLFGKTLRGKDSVESLANKVLDNGYEISLHFAVDNNSYFVKEIRKRPKHGLYFYKNDMLKQGKRDPDTRKLIIEELGMSADDFRAIAFLGQRQTQLLVEGKESERAQMLIDIFGLSKYDVLITDCQTDVTDLANERKQLKETLARYEQEFESLEEAFLSDDTEIEKIDPDAVEKLEKRIIKLTDVMLQLRRASESLTGLVGRAEAAREQKDNVKRIVSQIKKLKAKLEAFPEVNTQKLQADLRDLKKKQHDVDLKILLARREINSVKAIKNRCPINKAVCPVDVPRKYRTKIIDKCNVALMRADADKIKLVTHTGELKEKQNVIEESKDIQNEIVHKTDVVKNIKIIDDTNIEKKKRKLNKYSKFLDKGTKQLNTLIDRKSNKAIQLALYAQRETAREQFNNALSNKEKSIEKLKTQIMDLGSDAQYLSGALSVFKKMKLYKIDLVLQVLNKNLAEVLAKISDNEYKAEFTSQRTGSKKKVLDKVNILVYDNYKVIPIELCSGGQATEVGLGVLLSTWKTSNAISQKGVSSLWLDEVFGPLNEAIIDRVFDSVVDIANDLGATSVKVISHRDLDSRLFDHFWDAHRSNGITSLTFR